MATDADAQWGKFNKELQEAMQSGDFQSMARTYFDMALQTYREGKAFRHLLEQRAKMELIHQRDAVFASDVTIFATDNSCPACKNLAGKKYAIKDALAQEPLPCKECTFELSSGQPGWCRCLYLPMIEEIEPEPAKSQSTFTASSCIALVVLSLICGCALCWLVPALTK